MKSVRRIEMIPREYWSCRDSKHRHTTERIAQNCINKHTRGPSIYRWTEEEFREILADHESGMSYKKLGNKWERSSTRMAQIIKRIYRIKKHGDL